MRFVIALVALALGGCVTRRYAELRYWQGRLDSTMNCAELVSRKIP